MGSDFWIPQNVSVLSNLLNGNISLGKATELLGIPEAVVKLRADQLRRSDRVAPREKSKQSIVCSAQGRSLHGRSKRIKPSMPVFSWDRDDNQRN